jgi:signal transduction histidine kinase/DNA-binding response OmpR family regulator
MRFSKKTIKAFLFLLISSQLMLSCKKEKQEKFHIGFSQCCDDPWRDVMNAEMYRELNFHPDIDFEIQVANNSNETQIHQIKALISQGIDLLIVAPNESDPLTPVVEEVFQSGIPVIMIDRKTASERYTAYLGADNYEIGKTAANYIANKFDGQGRAVELKLPTNISPAVERNRGFKDALEMYPALKIIAELEIDTFPISIDKQLPGVLEAYPDINIIFSHTDLIAERAYEIADSMGLADQIFFVGVDGVPGTGRGIQAVEDGILDASMLYPTGGVEAIRLALAILNNLPYERKTLLQTTVIDQSNARILHLQMKKVSSLQESIDEQIQGINELETVYRNQQIFIIILISSLLLSIILGLFLWKSLRAKQAVNRSLAEKNNEILKQKEEIQKMSDKAQIATQAKVNFFTNISHELRTPLTLILGFAEDLLPKDHKNESQSINLIKQNAYRLLRLVNQLMDFRKIESDRMRVRASENDLIAFINHIMQSYHKVAEKHDIDFKLFTRYEHLSVWFDVNMLDKVLFNLLSNAFKNTPDGGKIHLSITVDNFENLVMIKVEDTGKGIAEEDIPHVFEPFYQDESGISTGTGIGLSLSQALIKLHQGEITLKSKINRGSQFIINLPLGNTHFTDGQLISAQPETLLKEEYLLPLETHNPALKGQQQSSAKEHKLLIIEDNPDMQFFLTSKLNAFYETEVKGNGEEGLQHAFQLIPDLIICDIMLPGMNGLDISKNLKSDLRTSHIPIILLSSRSTIEQQIEGTKTGADAYVTKPFNIEFLYEKIRNLLHNRQMLKDAYNSELININLSNHTNTLDQDFIQKFVTYIEQNYHRQDFQVTDLCGEMNLSRSQLYRKVKALLGLSISDYIQNTRLKKAKALLQEEQLSISEIAYQVGYNSPDYFTTVFKSKYDMAPTQFRKNLLGKNQA